MEAQADIERGNVAPGGIITLRTLDSTSPVESYKFPQPPKLQPSLELHTMDSLELWYVTDLCVLVSTSNQIVRSALKSLKVQRLFDA